MNIEQAQEERPEDNQRPMINVFSLLTTTSPNTLPPYLFRVLSEILGLVRSDWRLVKVNDSGVVKFAHNDQRCTYSVDLLCTYNKNNLRFMEGSFITIICLLLILREFGALKEDPDATQGIDEAVKKYLESIKLESRGGGLPGYKFAGYYLLVDEEAQTIAREQIKKIALLIAAEEINPNELEGWRMVVEQLNTNETTALRERFMRSNPSSSRPIEPENA